MTITTFDNHVTSTITASTAGDSWRLKSTSFFEVSGTALDASANAAGRSFFIAGDIDATFGLVVGSGDGSSSSGTTIAVASSADITATETAIAFAAAESSVMNGGTLEAEIGIQGLGSQAIIENSGTIRATQTAVEYSGSYAEVHNSGLLLATDGEAVNIAGFATRLTNDGVIRNKGNSAAVFSDTVADDFIIVVNDGKIISDKIAFKGNLAGESFTNTGTVTGNIMLGGGVDVFDGRDGIVKGRIFGGDGDDRFTIDKGGVEIVEKAGQGSDSVTSYASYKLSVNIEKLFLSGKADLNATGNDTENTLLGNSGDNKLRGEGGADEFQFADGSGRDTILDYTDGSDKIALFFNEVPDFATLKPMLKQVGDDVVIDFGGGDRLTILDVKKADLDAGDFSF